MGGSLPPDDHDCSWRRENDDLRAKVVDLEGKLAAVMTAMEALERRVLGPKSEKMPPVESEIRRHAKEDAEQRRLAALRRRRDRAATRDQLRKQTIQHHLSDEEKRCPRCGGTVDRSLPGKQTVIYEYVPGYFVKQLHVQEKAACRCGEHIATAPPPANRSKAGTTAPASSLTWSS